MRAVFLTTADPDIGLGHLYRCDALATALNEWGVATTIVVDTQAGPSWLVDRAPESPWTVASWTSDTTTLSDLIVDTDRIVVDAYGIDPKIREVIDSSDGRVTVFDDQGSDWPTKGVVVNGGPGAVHISYPQHKDVAYLIGPQYQVLRKAFRRPVKRAIRNSVDTIGVMLGGTDHRRRLSDVIAAIRTAVPHRVRILAIGAGESAVSRRDAETTGRLTPDGISRLFDEIDLLVTAAGQTVAEAVSRGLPCVMVQTAENQQFNVRGWTERGCAAFAGAIDEESDLNRITSVVADTLDRAIRERLSVRAQDVELWKAADWVADEVIHGEAIDHGDLVLRPFYSLSESEAREVLRWRNDERVRLWMDTRDPISFDTHRRFIDRLNGDQTRAFFLVYRSGNAIGVINLSKIDRKNRVAELGLYRRPDLAERGVGKILMSAIEWYAGIRSVETVRLKVRHDNHRAIALYRGLGYATYGEDTDYRYQQKVLA